LPKIFELEQHIADLIAAGEVVQRPASAVKELMENSIDSGASIITVEISSGGMTYIRVTDNGCGIAAIDLKTAFLRHATSKLRDAKGLEAIGTLGFRGEALAAIAAVSRIEVLTREPDSAEGTSLSLEAGEVAEISPAGCPEGTTIIVRDLFFNTPARLKFMKTDRAEGSAVASLVLRCALSRPDISIRFIKDGKTEYHTPGDSRVESCIYSLLGKEFEAGLLEAEASDENVSVEGFVSSPSAARGNRSYQFFFVNGRVIRSLLLQSALEQAYKNSIPSGRFPSCVLYISTKPCNVDVNVHPAKTEVKFLSDKQVFDGVYYAALGALEKSVGDRVQDVGDRVQDVGDRGQGIGHSSGNTDGSFKVMQADKFRKDHVSEPFISYPLDPKPYSLDPNSYPLDPKPYPLSPIPAIRFIGEVLNLYIVIEYQNSVWFIDKHAAHERIHFNALKNSDYEPMSESLIMPVICRPGHEDASLLLENEAFLEKLGFSVESFGDDSVAVRYIPAEIDIGDTESVLSDICIQLRHHYDAEPIQRDNIFKAVACKAAIKAGRASGSQELEALAARVMSGELSHCPHGRPVAFEITRAVLDKGFGRV